MSSFRFTSLVLAVGVLVALTGCSSMSKPPTYRTVAKVDLDRYLGRWWVIAYVPNFLENGKVGTADVYERRPDGRLTANYMFRRDSLDAPEKEWKGVAEVTNPATNAEWKVQLFWPFWADYHIIELDPDYAWAVVVSRGGKWMWVLARQTTLPDSVYRDIVDRVGRQGLDASALVKVPQRGS